MIRLYDRRLNITVQPDEIPEDVKLVTLEQFCRANGVAFYSLHTFVDEEWVDDREFFRVGTQEVPSRGLNISFDRVRTWYAELQKADMTEGRALCEELPKIEHRLRVAGLHKTALLLRDAVKSIGWEYAEKLGAKTSIDA